MMWKRAFGSEGHKSPEGLGWNGRVGSGPSGPRNTGRGSPGPEGVGRRQERSSERVAGPRVQAPGVSTLFGPPTPGLRSAFSRPPFPARLFPPAFSRKEKARRVSAPGLPRQDIANPRPQHLAGACMAAAERPVNDIWVIDELDIQYVGYIRFSSNRLPCYPHRHGRRRPTIHVLILLFGRRRKTRGWSASADHDELKHQPPAYPRIAGETGYDPRERGRGRIGRWRQ